VTTQTAPEGIVSSQAHLSSVGSTLRAPAVRRRAWSLRYPAGVLAVAAAYYASAKLGQTLRYTGSVAAMWPPAGVGIAVLYRWGLRWWPGVFIAELIVNAELLGGPAPLPLGSLAGQQVGNMVEVVGGAMLLRGVVGPRATLERVGEVGGVLAALSAATAASATVGTLSMLWGDVIVGSEVPTFWRTWWLGDLAGGIVFVPLLLVWAQDPASAWARLRTREGALMILAVTALGVIGVSTDAPLTYLVFPALIWAACRFGPPGATLSIAIVAVVAIAVTAHEMGPFSKQTIDHRTLGTQLYIVVTALTILVLSAVVSERARAARELAQARRREGERALLERRRIARDLHDSVSQALFSALLHTRTAQKAIAGDEPPALARSLGAVAELTRDAQSEMRALIFELGRDADVNGLAGALTEHAARLGERDGLTVDVQVPAERLALAADVEAQLFGIAREALANVVKHAGASTARVRVSVAQGAVSLEIGDDGRGFDAAAGHPGHFGLESMRSRAAEIDAVLTIATARGRGTVVKVEAPVRGEAGDA
jgi:signal transduction histidine kinase